jgi:hypothetical protein
MHHSVPDPIFYGSERLIERGSDLGMAHPLIVGHFQGHSLLLGECAQGIENRFPRVRLNKRICARRRRRRLRLIFQTLRSPAAL